MSERDYLISRRDFLKATGKVGLAVVAESASMWLLTLLAKNAPPNKNFIALQANTTDFFENIKTMDDLGASLVSYMEKVTKNPDIGQTASLLIKSSWIKQNTNPYAVTDFITVFAAIFSGEVKAQVETATSFSDTDNPTGVIAGLDQKDLKEVQINIGGEFRKVPKGTFDDFEKNCPELFKYKPTEPLLWYQKSRVYYSGMYGFQDLEFEKRYNSHIVFYEAEPKNGHYFQQKERFIKTYNFFPTRPLLKGPYYTWSFDGAMPPSVYEDLDRKLK